MPATRVFVKSALVLVVLTMGLDTAAAMERSPDTPDMNESQQPMGAPQPDENVRDPDFGVLARHFGLERNVEMYQWHATAQGYARGWSARPLDSSGFATGHANPAFPLQSRRWLPDRVSIDGKPLAASVLETLGEWRAFRPSFEALPGNLSATFQPQGDGLGSAENPLDPQVGDLRIAWRELLLPPLQDKVALRDGRWQLRLPPSLVHPTSMVAVDTAPERLRLPKISLLFAALHVFVLIALLVPISRHRHGQRIGLGHGGDELLARKIRVHGNFVENVPIALLMLALLELGGMPTVWLWAFGSVLLLARVMHAVGLSRTAGESIGRFYGTALTWLDLLAMAIAGLWLVW